MERRVRSIVTEKARLLRFAAGEWKLHR